MSSLFFSHFKQEPRYMHIRACMLNFRIPVQCRRISSFLQCKNQKRFSKFIFCLSCWTLDKAYPDRQCQFVKQTLGQICAYKILECNMVTFVYGSTAMIHDCLNLSPEIWFNCSGVYVGYLCFDSAIQFQFCFLLKIFEWLNQIG